MPRDGGGRRALSDDERVLWSTVTKKIAPLRERPHALPADLPADAAETAAPAPAKPKRAPIHGFAPPAVLAKPAPPPLAPLGRRKRARVARGKDEIDGRVDLHGLTQSEAHAALARFLRQASARGARLVLVITGKGGKGADLGERGVLRRQLPHWLALPEFRELVIGFEQAGPRHGGEGAWYISVRRSRDAE
jgi:DNA-nicking Smr family endonuclease